MKPKQTIEILVPLYNSELWIRDLIQSLEEQNDTYFSVSFLDDFSDSEVIEIIANSNLNFKYTRNEKNLGTLRTTLKLIAGSEAQILILLDHDDLLQFDFIYEVRELQLNDKEPILCIPNLRKFSKGNKSKIRAVDKSKITSTTFLFENPATGSGLVITKELSDTILKVDFVNEYFFDHQLFAIASNIAEIRTTEKLLINYRLHNSNQLGMGNGLIWKIENYHHILKNRQKALRALVANESHMFQSDVFGTLLYLDDLYASSFFIRVFRILRINIPRSNNIFLYKIFLIWRLI